MKRLGLLTLLSTFCASYPVFPVGTLGERSYNDRLNELIKKLGDDDPKVRDDAQNKITKLIKKSKNKKLLFSEIKKVIKENRDEEIRSRLRAVMEILKGGVWKKMSASPLEGRYYHRSVAYKNKVIIWGGGGNGNVFNDGAIYDVDEDKWTKMSESSLKRRCYHTMSIIGDRIYVWGGLESDVEAAFDDGSIYDIKKDSWKKMSKGPLKGRAAHSAVVVGGDGEYTTQDPVKIIFWGGQSKNGEYYNNGAIYNVEKDSWRKIKDAPIVARGYHSAAICSNKMVIWGGTGAGSPYNDGAVYDIAKDNWELMGKCPLEGRYYQLSTLVNNKLFIWGGYDVRLFKNGAVYDIEEDSWNLIDKCPLNPRASHVQTLCGNNLIIWGGHDPFYNDGAIYDIKKTKWTRIDDSVLSPRCYHIAEMAGDRLVIWGGLGPISQTADDGAVYELPILDE